MPATERPTVVYDAELAPNGIEALRDGLGGTGDFYLLHNSNNLAPVFVYGEGSPTSTPTWPALAGQTLVSAGSGTEVARQYAPVGSASADYAMGFAGGANKHLQYSSSGYGAVGTDDFFLWVALETPPDGTAGYILGDLGSSDGGYSLYWSAGTLYAYYRDDSGIVDQASISSLPNSVVLDLCFAFNQDVYAYLMIGETNGYGSGGTAGTITENNGLAIGANKVGATSSKVEARIFGAALWKGSSVIGTSDQVRATYRQISSLFWGSALRVNDGQSLISNASYSNRGSLTGILRENADGSTRVFQVYNHIYAVSRTKITLSGSTGSFLDTHAKDGAPPFHQFVQAPDDIDGTGWTRTNVTSGTAAASPDQAVDAQGWDTTSAAGNVEHSCSVTETIGGSSFYVDVCAYAIVKAEEEGYFRISFAGTYSGYGFFNLSSGAKGSSSGLDTHDMIPLGGGYYLVWVGMSNSAGSWSCTAKWLISPDGSSTTYTGSDTTDVRVIRCGLLDGTQDPFGHLFRSDIDRASDWITWAITEDTGGEGRVETTIASPMDDHQGNDLQVWKLNEDQSSAEQIELYLRYGSRAYLTSATAVGDQGSTSVVCTGDFVDTIQRWKTDSLIIEVVGGASGTEDTTVDPPTINTLHFQGPISKFALFPDYESPAATGSPPGFTATAQGPTTEQSWSIDVGLASATLDALSPTTQIEEEIDVAVASVTMGALGPTTALDSSNLRIQWTKLTPAHDPTPVYWGGFGYSPFHHISMLYGGYTGSAVTNDHWLWDGTDWTQYDQDNNGTAVMNNLVITARDWHEASHSSRVFQWKRLYSFGGQPTFNQSNYRVYDMDIGSLPPEFDIYKEFGVMDDTDSYTHGDVRPAIAYDFNRERHVMFGGWLWFASQIFPTATTYFKAEHGWTHNNISPRPPQMEGGTMCFVASLDKMFLFAGIEYDPESGGNDLKNVWEFDCANETWTDRGNSGMPFSPGAQAKILNVGSKHPIVICGDESNPPRAFQWNTTTHSFSPIGDATAEENKPSVVHEWPQIVWHEHEAIGYYVHWVNATTVETWKFELLGFDDDLEAMVLPGVAKFGHTWSQGPTVEADAYIDIVQGSITADALGPTTDAPADVGVTQGSVTFGALPVTTVLGDTEVDVLPARAMFDAFTVEHDLQGGITIIEKNPDENEIDTEKRSVISFRIHAGTTVDVDRTKVWINGVLVFYQGTWAPGWETGIVVPAEDGYRVYLYPSTTARWPAGEEIAIRVLAYDVYGNYVDERWQWTSADKPYSFDIYDFIIEGVRRQEDEESADLMGVGLIQPAEAGDLESAPSFSAPLDAPGVDQLPAALTINGVTEYPRFRYRGGDATASAWSKWVYGEDLSIYGPGTAPDLNEGSPLGGASASDDSVLFKGTGAGADTSQRYTGTAGLYDPHAKDYVVEGLFRMPDSTPVLAGTILSIKDSPGGTTGVDAYISSSPRLVFRLLYNPTYLSVTSDVLELGTWCYFMGFVNRDEDSTYGVRLFVDRFASVGGNFYQNNVDVAPNAAWAIGGNALAAPAGYCFGGAVAFLSYYLCTNGNSWHKAGADALTEWTEIFEERREAVLGTYPEIANGDPIPSAAGRTTPAYVDRFEADSTNKLYWVPKHWPRLPKTADGVGYLDEPGIDNLLVYTEDVSNGNWGKSNLTSVTSNGTKAPNGKMVADGIVGNTSSASHGFYRGPFTPVAGWHSLTLFLKKGDQDWGNVGINNNGVTYEVWFDLVNGTVGTNTGGSNVLASIWPYKYGFWRVRFSRLLAAVAGTYVGFNAAPSDGTTTFAGDAVTVNMWAWGMQLERRKHPTSYYPSLTTSATRGGDRLTYVGNDGNVPQSPSYRVKGKLLIPAVDLDVDRTVLCLSDGTSSNRTKIAAKASTNVAEVATAKSGGDAGLVTGSSDIADGDWKQVEAICATDSLRLYVEGQQEGTPDAAVDPFDAVTVIDVGSDEAGGGNLSGLVKGVKVF